MTPQGPTPLQTPRPRPTKGLIVRGVRRESRSRKRTTPPTYGPLGPLAPTQGSAALPVSGSTRLHTWSASRAHTKVAHGAHGSGGEGVVCGTRSKAPLPTKPRPWRAGATDVQLRWLDSRNAFTHLHTSPSSRRPRCGEWRPRTQRGGTRLAGRKSKGKGENESKKTFKTKSRSKTKGDAREKVSNRKREASTETPGSFLDGAMNSRGGHRGRLRDYP